MGDKLKPRYSQVHCRERNVEQYFTLPTYSLQTLRSPKTVQGVRVQCKESEYSASKVQGKKSKESLSSPTSTILSIMLGLCSDSVRTLLGFCSKTSFLTSFFLSLCSDVIYHSKAFFFENVIIICIFSI